LKIKESSVSDKVEERERERKRESEQYSGAWHLELKKK